MKGRLRTWRGFYYINRDVFPNLNRRQALWSAFRAMRDAFKYGEGE